MKSVYFAGHGEMVGSALVRLLGKRDDVRLITRSRAELDLTNQADVSAFFAETDIHEVYLAAARVGGIVANSKCPTDFIYQNLIIKKLLVRTSNLWHDSNQQSSSARMAHHSM